MREITNPWLKKANETITSTKHLLVNFSIIVRSDQYKIFFKNLRPNVNSKILDVGTTSDETLKDSNIFERLYKWPRNIVAATIENEIKLKKLYPKIGVVRVYPHKPLPFKDKSFDIAVSWATLEHVGNYKNQERFLNELLRVGNKIFVTTPYRGIFYEPHTGFFFLHWLPLCWFRKICKQTGKKFWSTEDNLNPLWMSDLKKMRFKRNIKYRIYKTFNIFPSHIIITN